MSLTISPKVFSLGYAPQLNSRGPKPEGAADPSEVELLGSKNEDSVELSGLKIIPEENDIASKDENPGNPGNPGNSDYKTKIRIDPETQEVIIKVVDEKTGEEVRQIPGEQQLRLNKGISEYNDILSKRDESIAIDTTVDDVGYKEDKSEQ